MCGQYPMLNSQPKIKEINWGEGERERTGKNKNLWQYLPIYTKKKRKTSFVQRINSEKEKGSFYYFCKSTIIWNQVVKGASSSTKLN